MSAAADRGEILDAGEPPRVADDPRDRRRRRGEWRREERPSTLALPALEVAVARAHRVLARRELVAVHRDAHRAARLTPFGPRGSEDVGQTLGFGLALDLVAAGD